MRPGEFYDRPPMWPIPTADGHSWGRQGCIHLKTSSYAVFYINGHQVQQVQVDFLQSDSTSPAYIKNKPEIPQPIQADFNCSDSTSPAYIKNKPVIADQQVQADFLQSDSTAPSYIRNKPDIPKLQPQVQVDFLQSDSTSPAYIWNKPVIVQADFNCSDSTSPAYIRNKPASYGGSSWDEGDTQQDQGSAGMDWIDG